MTLQEIFNNAYLGIMGPVQNGRKCTISEFRVCSYDDGKGCHCAIGWSIPKGHPSLPKYSTRPVTELIQAFPDLPFADINIFELCELQSAHDKAIDPTDMKQRLECFAKKYKLLIPELTT